MVHTPDVDDLLAPAQINQPIHARTVMTSASKQRSFGTPRSKNHEF